MARLSRLSVAGMPHHVAMLPALGVAVFRSDEDYLYFLGCLGEAAAHAQVAVNAYVLMPGGVHLALTPERSEGISGMLQRLSRRYVQWFNGKYGRTGTLWKGRFQSCVVDPAWELECWRYIEEIPVRERVVSAAGQFIWSSFPHHAGMRADYFLADSVAYWTLGGNPQDRHRAYQDRFLSMQDENFRVMIERATRRGKPLGSESFINGLPGDDNRKRWPLFRGRPPGRCGG